MSFSKKVKEELSRQISLARHCQIAEITAIISMCGRIVINERHQYFIKIHTENLTVARKYFTLIKETFLINCEVLVKGNQYLKKSKLYVLMIKDTTASLMILKTTKLLDRYGEIKENLSTISNLIIQNTCCKRAFIRGTFLAAGSISDPEKTYHLEIVAASLPKARQLCEIINTFKIEAKIVLRKRHYVVYIKESAQIVELLGVMEAHISLMDLENIRILKEMRNSINRQVNCETANINKTVTASSKQLEDIKYLQNTVGLGDLTEGLEEIARLRLKQPEASLKELGEMLNPPISKSGVNHRLRKISNIAESVREQKGGNSND